MGLPAGFSRGFEGGSSSMKTKMKICSFRPTLKNEDVKNPNIWLAEEWRLSIATFVEDEDRIFKTVEDWRFKDSSWKCEENEDHVVCREPHNCFRPAFMVSKDFQALTDFFLLYSKHYHMLHVISNMWEELYNTDLIFPCVILISKAPWGLHFTIANIKT
mgnify:CR=1 FL=1